jgi:outer membrane protein TolC
MKNKPTNPLPVLLAALMLAGAAFLPASAAARPHPKKAVAIDSAAKAVAPRKDSLATAVAKDTAVAKPEAPRDTTVAIASAKDTLLAKPVVDTLAAPARRDSLANADTSARDTIFRLPPAKALQPSMRDSTPESVMPESTVSLSLSTVLADLVRYNPKIVSARLEYFSESMRALSAFGSFEPAVVGGVNYNTLDRPTSVMPQTSTSYNLGVEGKVASGGNYNLGFKLDDLFNSRNIYDVSEAFFGVTGSQPLLRGLWFGSPVAKVRLAYHDRDITLHQFRVHVMETVLEAENAYWALAFNQEKVRFALESVNTARKIVQDRKEALRRGMTSPLDTVEAAAGLASRLAALAEAKQELRNASNSLKLLLSRDLVGERKLAFAGAPIFVSPDSLVVNIDIDSLSEGIRVWQPEYVVRKIELSKSDILVGAQRDQALPELNLTGKYGYSGQARDGALAMTRLAQGDYHTWTLGVQFRAPIFADLENRSLLQSEKYKHKLAEENLATVRFELANTLRTLFENIDALRARILSTRQIVDFRRQLMKVELEKLKAGKSNTRTIFETEEHLATSQQEELESNVRYRIALTQLSRVAGDLLRVRGYETLADGKLRLSDEILHKE